MPGHCHSSIIANPLMARVEAACGNAMDLQHNQGIQSELIMVTDGEQTLMTDDGRT
jgi:uncharacterized cupin superfamily protein